MEFFGEGLNNTEFLKVDTDGKGPQFVVGGSQDQFTSTWNGVSPIWNLVSAGDVTISDSSLVAFDRADRTGIFEIGQSTRQVRLLKPGGGQTRLGDSSLQDCITYSESPKIFESRINRNGQAASHQLWGNLGRSSVANFSRIHRRDAGGRQGLKLLPADSWSRQPIPVMCSSGASHRYHHSRKCFRH